MASEGSAMSDAQTAMNALTDLVTTPAFDQGKVPVPLKALGHLADADRFYRAEVLRRRISP